MATPDQALAATERLANEVANLANELKKRTASAYLRVVVLSTPKLTGTARFNYRVGLGGPVLSFTPLADDLSQAGQAEDSIAFGLAQIRSARIGEAIHITSIVPYLPELDRGTSPKASAGFINRARNASLNVAGDAARFIETRLRGPVFRG